MATFTVRRGPYGEGAYLECDNCGDEVSLDDGTSFAQVTAEVDSHECVVADDGERFNWKDVAGDARPC